MSNVESGILPLRAEYVRESTYGSTPTDPAWLTFSDQIQSVSYSPSTAIAGRRSVGSPDVNDFLPGSEDHEIEVTYDLQKWFSASGDAAYDGLDRNSDGCLPSSHSLLMRNKLGGSGVAGGGSYRFLYAKGAKIDSVNLSGDPGSGEPVMATVSYLAQKARVYKVDWPSSATTLDVQSTDSGDTMDLTIEDEDASSSETVTLTGTTTVSTTTSFGSIDAFELSAEPTGDITIDDGSGNTLVTIHGSSSYEGREGDLGVPQLGSGSHEGSLGTSFEIFAGDSIVRPDTGSDFIDPDIDINSLEATVENNLEATDRVTELGKTISEGARDVTVSSTIFGKNATFQSIDQHLRANQASIQWTLDGGNLVFDNAVLMDPGTPALETEQAVMTVDASFEAEGLTIN